MICRAPSRFKTGIFLASSPVMTASSACGIKAVVGPGFVRARITGRDERGRPIMMAGTHADLSERKAAEFALRASNQARERTGRIANLGRNSASTTIFCCRRIRPVQFSMSSPAHR